MLEPVFFGLDGTVWTTDKDGPIMDLLAAEITARTGKDPGEHYRELTGGVRKFLLHAHRRTGLPEQKSKLQKLSPDAVKESDLAGEPITAKLTRAPGNNAPDRRAESRGEKRLVRSPALRDREHLQNLCRELPERAASELDRD